MNGSVGNSLLLYLVVFVVGVVILFYVGIISYSKAYRVKDNIIEIIEKYEGYDDTNEAMKDELKNSLSSSGYGIATSAKISSLCDNGRVRSHMNDIDSEAKNNKHAVTTSDYNYCVFEVKNKSANKSGKYYVVVTFVRFDFPLIGEFINIPIYGETKVLGKVYDY